MGFVAVNEVGNVYGKLTVVGRALHKLKKDGRPDNCAIWECRCECGETALVRGQGLRSGNSRSCGCMRRDNQLLAVTKPTGVSATNRAIATMMANARQRGIEWQLSMDLTRTLISRECHYCGVGPSNLAKGRNGNSAYNGIDRVRNDGGYVVGNVVTCCFKCNNAKRGMTLPEFRDWARALFVTFVDRGSAV